MAPPYLSLEGPGFEAFLMEGPWESVREAERRRIETAFGPLIAGWGSAKRRAHFLAGRRCAMRALALLGHRDAAPVGVTDAGLPAWPAGVVGSITHTEDYAKALVAHEWLYAGVGIDAETVPRTEGRLEALRARAATVAETALCTDIDEADALTMVFSAKESLYKCLYPTCRRVMGFDAARLSHCHSDRGIAVLELTVDWAPALPRGKTFAASFALRAGRVETQVLWLRER